MKNLPVVDLQAAQRQALRERINLNNRPSLGARGQQLKAVSKTLASDSQARADIISNPTAFLNSQQVPVSSCNLVTAKQGQTSEACTVNVLCLVNVGAAINVVAAVNFYVYVFVSTKVYGYEEDVILEESMVFNHSPLNYGSAVL